MKNKFIILYIICVLCIGFSAWKIYSSLAVFQKKVSADKNAVDYEKVKEALKIVGSKTSLQLEINSATPSSQAAVTP